MYFSKKDLFNDFKMFLALLSHYLPTYFKFKKNNYINKRKKNIFGQLRRRRIIIIIIIIIYIYR